MEWANVTGYGVTDCAIDSISADRGLSVFIDSLGRAYGAGRSESLNFAGSYGWDLSDPSVKKQATKVQRAPPQLLKAVGRVDRVQVLYDVIFFQSGNTLRYLDLRSRDIFVPQIGQYRWHKSATYGEYLSFLPPHLEGRIVSFAIDENDEKRLYQLIVLDLDGKVHLGKIDLYENQLTLEFRSATFAKLDYNDETFKYIDDPLTYKIVNLTSTRAKGSPSLSAIMIDENDHHWYISEVGIIQDIFDVFNIDQDRNRQDYYELQIGHPYHMKGWDKMHATFNRIMPFVDSPKVDM